MPTVVFLTLRITLRDDDDGRDIAYHLQPLAELGEHVEALLVQRDGVEAVRLVKVER